MANKRRVPRYPCRLRVRYRDGQESDCIAFSADVSSMGMYVPTPTPESIGRNMEIRAILPTGEVRLQAIVAWAKSTRAHLTHMMHGGFGLQVTQAPDSWYRYCRGLESGDVVGDVIAA